MPKFITTTETAYLIEKLITDANKFVCIISPYINIHERLKKIIERHVKKNKLEIIFVCRQEDLKSKERKWIETLPNCVAFFNSFIHAKCYFNEKSGIVTSLNLYEYSMVNNIEFGFSFENSEDAYKQVIDECSKLIDEKNGEIISQNKVRYAITSKYNLKDINLEDMETA